MLPLSGDGLLGLMSLCLMWSPLEAVSGVCDCVSTARGKAQKWIDTTSLELKCLSMDLDIYTIPLQASKVWVSEESLINWTN